MRPNTVRAKAVFLFRVLVFAFLVTPCLSEQYHHDQLAKSSGCERHVLKAIDKSFCKKTDEPEMTTAAIRIVSCRLSLLGKPELKCVYSSRKGSFDCTSAMSHDVVEEVLTVVLEILERCHASSLEYFHVEVATLIDKLSVSARIRQDMHTQTLQSKTPLKLLKQIISIQQDGATTQRAVLRKASLLQKEATGIRNSIAKRVILLKVDAVGKNVHSTIKDCLSAISDRDEGRRKGLKWLYVNSLWVPYIHVDWIFSLTASSLFLLMIRKMEGGGGSPLTLMREIAMYALRAHSSSQNRTAFLEQFFVETVIGHSLLSLLIWISNTYCTRS